jgi:hypothetical protein
MDQSDAIFAGLILTIKTGIRARLDHPLSYMEFTMKTYVAQHQPERGIGISC